MSPASSTVPTRHWHEVSRGRVQCDVCPRLCRLREGQRGLCFVRACENGQVVLTTHSRSSGFCVDPIEKKPLYHFLPGTSVLSFGTAGCNLACRFCQNWEITKARALDVLTDDASPQTIARVARALGCPTVAMTYNDPVCYHEYAVDVARACREAGVRVVLVTAGYVCEEPREELFRNVDAVNVDLKAFTDEFYRSLCSGSLKPVLDTILYLKRETSAWLELTTLLIPGENDSDSEIDRMTRWVVNHVGPDVPMHFTAFHPSWKMSDRRPTPASTVVGARHIALGNGVRHVYAGNVDDPAGAGTYCHQCGAELIRRSGHRVVGWALGAAGECGNCGASCAGVFEAAAGTWGGRRLSVSLGEVADRPG